MTTRVKSRKFFLVLVFLSGAVQSLYAQQQAASEYEIKAAFLYNFTRFIEWPAGSFTLPNDPFVIGIIGNNPFGTSLDDVVKGEKVGSHPIIVSHFKNVNEIDLCHILYINTHDVEYIRKILASVESKNILTVSDHASFPRLGGHIRFFMQNQRIRLQINSTSVKKSNLTISSKLLGLAKIY